MRNNLFFVLLHRLSRRSTPKCTGHSFRNAHLPSPRASGEAMGVNMDTIAYFASENCQSNSYWPATSLPL